MLFPFTLDHWEIIIASALIAGAVVTGVLAVVTVFTLLLTREHADEHLPVIHAAVPAAKAKAKAVAADVPHAVAG